LQEVDIPEPKAKGKCGRKRKRTGQEADVFEADVLEVDASEPTAKVARMSEALEPARATVM
jgi:hypothetical protein